MNMKQTLQTVVSGNSIADNVTTKADRAKFALIGKNRFQERLVWPIDEKMLSSHLLLMGGIGTGKSNTFYHLIERIRSTLTSKDVMIIFDTKGDYYKKFYRHGDYVISNDERACDADGPNYWNLFNEVTIDNRVSENILEVCNTLFSEKLQQDAQPFFPNAAKDLLYALMLHLTRIPQFANSCNNASLRAFLDTFSAEIMCRILDQHKDLKAMKSYISQPDSGQTQGVVSVLQQQIREVFVGNFAKRGSISIRNLIKQKGGNVIFIEYDLGIGSMLSPVYRLIFDLAIKQALCRKEDEGNVYFIIDEFRLLPHLQHIDDGVNFGRSLGAKFIVGIQNIEQIKHAYGEELAKSILSGFNTTIAFRLNDSDSRRYVSDLLGKNLTLFTYHSTIANRGIIEELRDTLVAEDWRLSSLQTGEAIISSGDCLPFQMIFDQYLS